MPDSQLLLLGLIDLVLEIFFFFLFGGGLRCEELFGEDVEGAESEEDGEENLPGDLVLHGDEDAAKDNEGDDGIVLTAYEILAEG